MNDQSDDDDNDDEEAAEKGGQEGILGFVIREEVCLRKLAGGCYYS